MGATLISPAIDQPGRFHGYRDTESVRRPEWYILRVAPGAATERRPGKGFHLGRLLAYNGFSFRQFLFEMPRPRRAPRIGSYFPGYLFVEMDLMCDSWQMITEMPGALRFLGEDVTKPRALPPSGAGSIYDLEQRLPFREPTMQKQIYARGTMLRVLKPQPGLHIGFVSPCVWSDERHVKIVGALFAGGAIVTLPIADVERVGGLNC